MIKPITDYTVVCDNCGTDFSEGGEYSGWNDAGFVRDMALEAGWIEDVDKRHYCTSCYEYDDDDSIILKVSNIIESLRQVKQDDYTAICITVETLPTDVTEAGKGGDYISVAVVERV